MTYLSAGTESSTISASIGPPPVIRNTTFEFTAVCIDLAKY